jgi:hypothetical protein
LKGLEIVDVCENICIGIEGEGEKPEELKGRKLRMREREKKKRKKKNVWANKTRGFEGIKMT